MSVQSEFLKSLFDELTARGISEDVARNNVTKFQSQLKKKAEIDGNDKIDAALSKIPPASIAENIYNMLKAEDDSEAGARSEVVVIDTESDTVTKTVKEGKDVSKKNESEIPEETEKTEENIEPEKAEETEEAAEAEESADGEEAEEAEESADGEEAEEAEDAENESDEESNAPAAILDIPDDDPSIEPKEEVSEDNTDDESEEAVSEEVTEEVIEEEAEDEESEEESTDDEATEGESDVNEESEEASEENKENAEEDTDADDSVSEEKAEENEEDAEEEENDDDLKVFHIPGEGDSLSDYEPNNRRRVHNAGVNSAAQTPPGERKTVRRTTEAVDLFDDDIQKKNGWLFYLFMIVLVPLVFFIGAALFGVFLVLWLAIALLSIFLVIAVVLLAASGSLAALCGLLFGVVELIGGNTAAAMFEFGLALTVGGGVLFVGILIYNFAVRFLPFIVKKLFALLIVIFKMFGKMFKKFKQLCANI